MAWERIALAYAAVEGDETLERVASTFGFRQKTENKQQEKKDVVEGGSVAEGRGGEKGASNNEVRPPARILHVVRNEKTANQYSRPDWLDAPDWRMLEQSGKGSYFFPLPQPIVPASQLTPLFINALGHKKKTRRLDQPQLIRDMALGKPFRKIPYRKQQRWPHRLHVIVDTADRLEPYWPDFEYIVTMLERILGEDSVEAVCLDEKSLADEQWDCIRWPTRPGDRFRPWNLPLPDTPMLILSDFGLCSGRNDDLVSWRRLADRVYQHPAPVLNLSPAVRSPDNVRFCRRLRPYPLNDLKPRFRYPGGSGFDLRRNQDDVIEEMLTLLSAFPLIDSALLRPLRNRLQWGGAELEGLFWNRFELNNIGLGKHLSSGYAKGYQQKYKDKYAGGPKAQMVWQVLFEHYRGIYRGLKQLALFNQSVQEGGPEDPDVRQYVQQICAVGTQTVTESGQGHRLRSCGKTFLGLIPEEAWQSDYTDIVHHLFGMVYDKEIKQGKLPESMPPGWDTSRLEYLLDKKAREEVEQWLLVQAGDQGEFRLFRRSSGSHDPVTPIVELESLRRLPPVLHLHEGGKAINLSADIEVGWVDESGSGAEIRRSDLSRTVTGKRERNGLVRVQSSLQTVDIECIERPSWALAIGYDRHGLWAEIPWLGKKHRVERASGPEWLWQSPFGEDRYGLYVDLEIKDCIQRFRWCEPGTFLMGSPEDEPERYGDETLHEVTLTQGFWLADTTVTQALWQAVMGENPSSFKGANRPVEQVSWEDVQRFLEKLNTLVPELSARLPWESEWEYGCRAGTSTPFSFGENITTDQVNFDGNRPYHKGEKGERRGETVAVKSLPCNNWGLYEMHGNVWEWCQDFWQADLSDKPVVDPHGPETGEARVVRGGSWISLGRDVRSAFRGRLDPASRFDYQGFRLARGH